MFCFETLRIVLNPSSVKKMKQHLAMSAIKKQKVLLRKVNVTQKTLKAKLRLPDMSKPRKARTNHHAENARKKHAKDRNLRKEAENSSKRSFADHCKRRMQKYFKN